MVCSNFEAPDTPCPKGENTKAHAKFNKRVAEIKKLTSLPDHLVRVALSAGICSYEMLRTYCVHQGELPTMEQQQMLRELDQAGKPYEYPRLSVIDINPAHVIDAVKRANFHRNAHKFNNTQVP